MYCTNCGKRVNDKYNFCRSCGNAIEDIEENEIVSVEQKEETNMKYFKFFSTIYLTIIIVLNIFILFNYINIEKWDIFISSQLLLEIILYVILPIKLLYELPKKTKFIYNLLLGFLILDYMYKVILVSINCYINNPYTNITIYMLLATIMYSIWYIPNIIYFVKRKSVFIN